MKLTNRLIVGAGVAMMMSSAVIADTMTAEQKKEMQQVVHDYIVQNPEVLVEASQALQQKQQETMQTQAKSAIQENAAQLFADTMTVLGNPAGNVTLVEFFDYQCVHCKKMTSIVDDLIKKNPNLRVIYKEFPIFGESSEYASKVALAAAMQGKYVPLHDALMTLDTRLNNELVMKTAKSLGLNMPKLEKDMGSKEVADALAMTMKLAEKMHLMGTPAFIVAATPNGQFAAGTEAVFIPGAASAETLQELITKADSAPKVAAHP